MHEDWEPVWSKRKECYYYVNQKTGVKSWEKPEMEVKATGPDGVSENAIRQLTRRLSISVDERLAKGIGRNTLKGFTLDGLKGRKSGFVRRTIKRKTTVIKTDLQPVD